MKLAEDALLATRENTDLNNTTQPKKKPVENRKRQTNNTSTIPKKKQKKPPTDEDQFIIHVASPTEPDLSTTIEKTNDSSESSLDLSNIGETTSGCDKDIDKDL